MIRNIEEHELAQLFMSRTPLIDVRAPIEFKQGSLPGAINLPILTDEERALVGTTYKQQGNAEAVKLGHRLVSGAVKEARVGEWMAAIKAQPQSVLYCFRGGQRSRITQAWLREAGCDRPLIVGGYKRGRQFLMSVTEQATLARNFLLLTGPTGSGKTQFLRSENRSSWSLVDLEAYARHRGSAFGGDTSQQPAQIDFENTLALHLLGDGTSADKPLLMEDESRLIGRNALPEKFFVKMRQSSVVWLEVPLPERCENILREYVLESAIGDCFLRQGSEELALAVYAKFEKALLSLQRRLGGLRTQQIHQQLLNARNEFLAGKGLDANRAWIEALLVEYYDPIYLWSLDRRQPSVAFRGSADEVRNYLKTVFEK